MKYIKNILIVLLALYSAFFLIGAVLVPVLSYTANYSLSANLNSILSNACHQNPERTFWLMGYPMALCARCFGVYLSVCISCLLLLADKFSINFKIFIILAIICSTDILLNLFNINTGNITRFFIGLLIGILITKFFNYIITRRKV